MLLNKTNKARTALQERPADLSTLDRRILILCDGHRSRDNLVGLLGPGTLPALERLVREGYLAPNAASTPAVTTAADAPAAPPRPVSRRSLAATKMYMVDMLQLQRDADAAALKASIQASPSEDELVCRVLQGLRHLHAVASATYGQRVSERLAEILPEAHLPTLELLLAERLAADAAVA